MNLSQTIGGWRWWNLIEIIKNLLKNKEWNVKKYGESLLLSNNRVDYPEDYIVIKRENTSLSYIVTEVHK